MRELALKNPHKTNGVTLRENILGCALEAMGVPNKTLLAHNLVTIHKIINGQVDQSIIARERWGFT